MRTSIFFILVFLVFSKQGKAQSTYELFKQLRNVTTIQCGHGGYTHCHYSNLNILEIDTSFMGLPAISFGTYFGNSLLYFDNQKVYVKGGFVLCEEDCLLFDFGVLPGDEVTFLSPLDFGLTTAVVTATDSLVLLNGEKRKTVSITGHFWIEGIGDAQHTFGSYPVWDNWAYNVCFHNREGEILYVNNAVYQDEDGEIPSNLEVCELLNYQGVEEPFTCEIDSLSIELFLNQDSLEIVEWSFNDDQYSTENNPFFVAETPGCYLLSLRALDKFLGTEVYFEKQLSFCQADYWKPIEEYPLVKDVYALNEDLLWIIEKHKIYHSKNGGENWVEQPFAVPESGNRLFHSLEMANEEQGIIACEILNGLEPLKSILFTKNGGKTWKESLSTFSIKTAGILPSGVAYAISGTNHLYKSINFGNTWDLQSDELPEIDKIHLISDQAIHGIGHADGQDYYTKSLDGGSNWQTFYFNENSGNNEDLLAIHFLDENEGFIAGVDGLLMKTVNGGMDWDTSYLSSGNDLLDIDFRNNGYGLIVGDQSSVFETKDFGENWDWIECGTNRDFKRVSVVSEEVSYAVDLQELYKSGLIAEDNCDQSSSTKQEDGVIINVFPNPFSDMLSIRLADQKAYTVELYSLQGSLLYTSQIIGQKDCLLSHLVPGVYSLKISDHKGNTSLQKVVKL